MWHKRAETPARILGFNSFCQLPEVTNNPKIWVIYAVVVKKWGGRGGNESSPPQVGGMFDHWNCLELPAWDDDKEEFDKVNFIMFELQTVHCLFACAGAHCSHHSPLPPHTHRSFFLLICMLAARVLQVPLPCGDLDRGVASVRKGQFSWQREKRKMPGPATDDT